MWSCRALTSATAFQKPQVLVQNQFTRWYRKPRWVPIAKGKVFRIPPRTTGPQEEYEELKRLHNNYRTQMKAVRKQLVNAHMAEMDSLANVKSEKSLREEKLELDRAFALNDEWNKKIAEEREIYFEYFEQHIEQKVKKIMEKKTAIKEHIIKVAEKDVQEEIVSIYFQSLMFLLLLFTICFFTDKKCDLYYFR